MVCPSFHQYINADVNGPVNIGNVAVDRFLHPAQIAERVTSGSGLLAQL